MIAKITDRMEGHVTALLLQSKATLEEEAEWEAGSGQKEQR